MRGLVMEVKEKSLVVLTSEGKYIHVKNTGTAAIGDFVPCDTPSIQINRFPQRVLAMAASLLLICSAGLGTYGYSQPFGVVNIDINPSMALTYNWFQRVIAVEALNSDAEKLLPELESLKNQPVAEAVEAAVEAASKAGYLKPELANVVFVSVSDRNNNGRSTALVNAIDKDLSELSKETETVVMSGTAKTYEHALKNHNSPVKELVESSLESKPESAPLTHADKPLKEILKEQKEKRDEVTKRHPPESDKPNAPLEDQDNGSGKENGKPSKQMDKQIEKDSEKPDVKKNDPGKNKFQKHESPQNEFKKKDSPDNEQ